MDGALKFAHEQNLSRFVDLLRLETDAARRDVLRRLLIEEEDRFGVNSARLDAIDVYLAEGAARIEQQAVRIVALANQGGDTQEALRLLHNLEDIQATLGDCRKVIVDNLDRSRL